MDSSSTQPFLEKVEDYRRVFDLEYSVDSIMKLEKIIDALSEDDKEIDSLSYAVWGSFYGQCFVKLLNGRWSSDVVSVHLWNNQLIFPFTLVSRYIMKPGHFSLVQVFGKYAIEFANQKKIDSSLNPETRNEKRANELFKSLGMEGFSLVKSQDELHEAIKAKAYAKEQLNILETIDNQLKEYVEYQEIIQLSVTGDEFKTKLIELKENVARNGDANKMMEIVESYWQKDRNTKEVTDENLDEALYWVKKAAILAQPEALFLLGTIIFKGIGVGKDKNKARVLIELACEKGNESACEFLKENF